MQAKMMTFLLASDLQYIVNAEIRKTIIAAGCKQSEGPLPKDPLQSGRLFSTNYCYFATKSSLKLQRY